MPEVCVNALRQSVAGVMGPRKGKWNGVFDIQIGFNLEEIAKPKYDLVKVELRAIGDQHQAIVDGARNRPADQRHP